MKTMQVDHDRAGALVLTIPEDGVRVRIPLPRGIVVEPEIFGALVEYLGTTNES
ncbi:MAG TPA: hypothetical protein VMR79_07040 [Verrucomicrobiae bacterium]|nr:hypothetical protein [Verrucomicrobiae bacterium]